MALNTPLLGAAPFSSVRCLGGSSVAASRVAKKRSTAVMRNPASAPRLSYTRAASDPFIVIDNGDDFTYGFCQYLCELRLTFQVCRNGEVTVDGLRRKNPRGIFISPGPGTPQDSGVSMQAIRELGPTVPIFGVCLGLQCISEAFGGKTVSVPSDLVNRESSKVYFNKEPEMCLFDNFSRPFMITQHDNLAVDTETFPHDTLEITAWTEDGLVMAARHKEYNHIQGIQFIPEHVFMYEGRTIVSNFLKLVSEMEKKVGKDSQDEDLSN